MLCTTHMNIYTTVVRIADLYHVHHSTINNCESFYRVVMCIAIVTAVLANGLTRTSADDIDDKYGDMSSVIV